MAYQSERTYVRRRSLVADRTATKSGQAGSMTKFNDLDVEYTWQSFIAYAESYGRSANYVAAGPRLNHAAPIGALACHCIELSLKAVLLSQGASSDDLRRYSHDLRRLFNATELDWTDLDTNTVDFYHDAVVKHAFRYRDSQRPYSLDPDHLLPLMEHVFHRCLQEIWPGANRTLHPM
jgi:hypothetical protein